MSDVEAVIDLGQLALAFGRVDRVTYHEDGETLESDTDHTVMLGLVGCALAANWYPGRLDLGLVAQYALVHDLVEVYAGDVSTLRIDAAGRQAKREREELAYLELAERFALRFPWLVTSIAEYEMLRTPEARFVKALDKLLPKITHLLNGGRTLHDQGMGRAELEDVYFRQQAESLTGYAGDFPELLALRTELAGRVLDLAPEVSQ